MDPPRSELASSSMTRLLVTAVVLVVGLLTPAVVADNGELIADILVEGNEALSDSAVLHHVRSRTGRRFDPRVVNEDEQRLLKTGRFSSVRAYASRTETGVVLTFEVAENPTISEIAFVNNKAFPNEKLSRELPYATGDPLSNFTVEANRKAVLAKYEDAGYQFAEVTAQVNGRQVVLTIVEGPKVSVRAVRFEGNSHFSSMKLRMAVQTNALFYPMNKQGLDEEKLQQDMQTLRKLFVDEGFLGAEVSRRLEYSDDKSTVTVVFVIAPHDRYRIGATRFDGNVVFDDQQLLRRLDMTTGDFMIANDLRLDLQSLRNTYGQIGYIEADIDVKVIYVDPQTPAPDSIGLGPDESLVNIIFTIVEHDQYRIGQIEIRGNTVTQERVIRRELRFYPEQLFDSVAVGKAKSRLMQTQLFADVAISPLESTDLTRNVLVDVTEGRTGQFLVGVGLSSNTGLLGNVMYSERNFDLFGWPRAGRNAPAFKGAGQSLVVQAEPGADLMRFRIEWTEPYLFDKPYALGVKAFMFTTGRDDYDETRIGPVVSLGHRFQNDWYGEVAARTEYVNIDGLSGSAPPEVMSDSGSHILVGLKGTLIKDRTDNRWTPTTGDRMRFSYEQVVGSYNFGRLEGEHRIFWTLHTDELDRKHVLAARVMAGGIIGDAPVFEKYYAGGAHSIRGFEYRGVSPRSAGTTKAIGGDFILLNSVEYGFPLIGKNLRGVVFLDAGTISEGFGLDTLRASIGTGLRWIVPLMGPVPVSLDFAFPIAQDDDDETQIFSFFLGMTF